MIQFVFKYGKAYFPIIILLNVLSGLYTPIQTILLKNIIDSAVMTQQEGFLGSNFTSWLSVFLIVQVLNIIVYKIDGFTHVILSNTLEIEWGKKLLGKCARIKYKYFEEPDTYDMIDRLSGGFRDNAVSIIDIVPFIIRITVSIVGILAIIMQVNWIVGTVLLLSSFPIWFLSIRSSMNERDTFFENYQFNLKANYFSSILTSREYIKENRLFQFHDFINDKWKSNLIRFQKGVLNSNIKQRFLAGGFVFVQYSLITLILFLFLSSFGEGVLTIGAFIALAQALWGYIGQSQSDIIGIIYRLNNAKYFKKDYDGLMGLTEYDDQSGLTESDGRADSIVLEDVWFRYSENSEYVLKGVNVEIHAQDTIALVGKNGSGKTTLVKLILGLLQPTKGKIFIDGIDIQLLGEEERKNKLSVIFQDFARYNISLRENVAISDITRSGDSDRILELLYKSGIDRQFIDSTPSGLDTIIGKNLDNGIDISGGQWQMVAIARALFSNGSILVMDEPTSSLDPAAEIDVYQKILELTKNKTVLMISHRLGSTRKANKTLVLDNGVIAEQGTHNELMKQGGIYAEMYETQRQWYE